MCATQQNATRFPSRKKNRVPERGDKTGHAVLVVAAHHALRADLALVLVPILLKLQELVPPAFEHDAAPEPARQRRHRPLRAQDFQMLVHLVEDDGLAAVARALDAPLRALDGVVALAHAFGRPLLRAQDQAAAQVARQRALGAGLVHVRGRLGRVQPGND